MQLANLNQLKKNELFESFFYPFKCYLLYYCHYFFRFVLSRYKWTEIYVHTFIWVHVFNEGNLFKKPQTQEKLKKRKKKNKSTL